MKKTVEKAAKEDQRARSRIVALEEGIRRAREAEDEIKGREREDLELKLREVEEEENRVESELGDWKEGGGGNKREGVVVVGEERRNSLEENKVGEVPGPSGLAELAKELDALNKAIEMVEREKSEKATEVLRALEREMNVVEGELIQ